MSESSTFEQWRTDVLRVWPEARFDRCTDEHGVEHWLAIDGPFLYPVGAYVANRKSFTETGPAGETGNVGDHHQ